MMINHSTFPLFRKLPYKALKPHEYAQAGWHLVQLTNFNYWTEIHVWCEQHFGNSYSWTGSQFWFTSPEDAAEFALTWC